MKTITQTIAEQVKDTMPDEVTVHYRAALHDLMYGPLGADHWRVEYDSETEPDYTFAASCKVVADWWNDVADVPDYCDEDGYAMTLADTEALDEIGSRPSFCTVDRNAVKAALFGQLAPYL